MSGAQLPPPRGSRCLPPAPLTAPVRLWGLVRAREKGPPKHIWRGDSSWGSMRCPVLLGLPTPAPIPTLAGVPRVKGALSGSRLRPEQSGTVVAQRPYRSQGLSRESCQEQTLTLTGMEDVLGLSAIPCLSRVRRRRPMWEQTQSTSSVPHQYFACTPTLAVWDTKAPLKVYAH